VVESSRKSWRRVFVVKGFEVPTEFYRCESCEEELMMEDQFRKGMDKIIELKSEILVR
jgi:hypothetical protein